MQSIQVYRSENSDGEGTHTARGMCKYIDEKYDCSRTWWARDDEPLHSIKTLTPTPELEFIPNTRYIFKEKFPESKELYGFKTLKQMNKWCLRKKNYFIYFSRNLKLRCISFLLNKYCMEHAK